ncbi:MAG: branched-chain amino acid ABC transporter permease, partial [Rhodobiaceae bacterium]|nr:branched-chain amino acid ABC transporter permease [Rhodobiaceae bacterium]
MNEIIFFINKVLINGTVIGSIYALGAVGVTLIFGILRFAHFAHGDLMTVGAFVALILTGLAAHYGITAPLPMGFVVMPIAMVATALLAIWLDRIFYKPLRDKGTQPVVMVMASLGVTLMMQGVVRLFAGTQARTFYFAEDKEIFRVDIPFGAVKRQITITEPQILLILFTIVTVLALHIFLSRTRRGKAMRAM